MCVKHGYVGLGGRGVQFALLRNAPHRGDEGLQMENIPPAI